MTFSIVAWDAATGMSGVAVATKHLAVGALVPFAQAGVGSIATQGLTNPLFGIRGLELLETCDAQSALALLLQDDEGKHHRQLHLVDRAGNTAAWTGEECVGWAGHQALSSFSVAGNMLVSAAPIAAMVEAYQSNPEAELGDRLLLALEAGEAAGGDRRGRQSAALYLVSTEPYPHLDLRVDDHAEPIAELRRLFLEAQQEYYVAFRRSLPTQANPAGTHSRSVIQTLIEKQGVATELSSPP